MGFRFAAFGSRYSRLLEPEGAPGRIGHATQRDREVPVLARLSTARCRRGLRGVRTTASHPAAGRCRARCQALPGLDPAVGGTAKEMTSKRFTSAGYHAPPAGHRMWGEQKAMTRKL